MMETSVHEQSWESGDERMSINISTLAVIERYVAWIKEETGQAAVVEVHPKQAVNTGAVARVVCRWDGQSLVWLEVGGHSLLAAVENLAGRLAVEERRGWSLEPLDRWRERLLDKA